MSYEAIQQAVRGSTGTAGTYEEDWNALFDDGSVPAGTFNERLLSYINTALTTSYTNLPDAMRAFAVANGATTWGEISSFTP